jgi:hypothetical protein
MASFSDLVCVHLYIRSEGDQTEAEVSPPWRSGPASQGSSDTGVMSGDSAKETPHSVPAQRRSGRTSSPPIQLVDVRVRWDEEEASRTWPEKASGRSDAEIHPGRWTGLKAEPRIILAPLPAEGTSDPMLIRGCLATTRSRLELEIFLQGPFDP